MNTRYDRAVVEQATIAGALNPEAISDTARAEALVTEVAGRLDIIAEETEKGWTGRLATPDDGVDGYIFERSLRGVKESVTLDMALLGSADARQLDRYSARLHDHLLQAAGAAPQGEVGFRCRADCPARSCFRRRTQGCCRCSATRVWVR